MILVKDAQSLVQKMASDVDGDGVHTPVHRVSSSELPDGAATEATLVEALARLNELPSVTDTLVVIAGASSKSAFGVVSGDLTSVTPAVLMPAVSGKVNTLTRITLANYGSVAAMVNVSDYEPGNVVYSAYVPAYDTKSETFERATAPKSSVSSALSVASEELGVSIRVSWGGITDTE